MTAAAIMRVGLHPIATQSFLTYFVGCVTENKLCTKENKRRNKIEI